MTTYYREPEYAITSGERLIIDIANDRAVIWGPMTGLSVSWLPNGVRGQILPVELTDIGYHIVQPEQMPAWLIARVDAAAQCADKFGLEVE